MQIFYAPHIDGLEYLLPEDESKHCTRVLRMKVGDELFLTDGCGNLHTARIADDNPKRCRVQVVSTQKEFGKRPFNLHIAIAPTKNIERFEWFLEKATEIGVDTITPLLCERSERKDIKVERLQKIVISAMKQSVKAYLPTINEIQPFRNFLKLTHLAEINVIAHCNSWELTPLQQLIHRGRSVLILIGPEGDFTPAEVNLALNSGFTGVSLSTSRLRTETAGVVACHTANLINGV